MTSATLTVAQAQSNSFLTAFAVGIQNAVPGVTVTVTSVSAARRRLLASVAVSYSASSATASTSALTASLSSSATIAAVSTSLVSAGYPGIVTSSPVFSIPSSGIAGASTSAGAGAGASGATIGAIAGGVIGGLVLLAAVVGGTLYHLVHVTKTHEWRGCKLQMVGSMEGFVQPRSQPYNEVEIETNQWVYFNPTGNNQPTNGRPRSMEIETNPQWASFNPTGNNQRTIGRQPTTMGQINEQKG